MLPRERVLAAISHEKPDRTPRDFWAEAPTWNRLLAFMGLPDRESILRRLGIDVRHLRVDEPAEHLVEGAYQNMWGERYVYQPSRWGPVRHDLPGALAQADSLAELEAFEWPSVDCLDHSQLAGQCRQYDRHALVYGFADIWERPALVRGFQLFFVDLIENPEWAHYLARVFTDFYLEDYTRAAEATNGRIDLYLILTDLGTQAGPLVSLAMFREFVKPYLAEMVDRIHSLGAKALFHSCGDIQVFIPDIIALGVDVLDPIQPVNDGMAPEALAEQFGGQICFHGGLDAQRLLPWASAEEVTREAQRYCEVLGAEGGYILGPAHLFQPDVPPENILAAYDG